MVDKTSSNRSANVVGAFSEEDACKLSGVSINQLRRWNSNGVLKASMGQPDRHQPYSRIYSFKDLVSLRVLNLLRNKYRVSGQHLKLVSEELSYMGDDRWTGTTLYVLGKKVVFDDPKSLQRQEVVGGQRVFDIPLKAAISDTLEAIRSQNKRKPSEQGRTIKKRFLQNSQSVFEGSRIPVTAVQAYIARGYSDSDILKEFPDLTKADIDFARSNGDASAA